MSNYGSRLAQYDTQFANAPVQGGDSELPPDGEYQCVINRFDFFEGKVEKGGHLYLKTEMQVVSPVEHKGWPVEVIHVLTDPERLSFVKTHLARLGITIERLSDLELALNDALDLIVEVAVKTSDRTRDDGTPYRNAYVNKVLGSARSDVTPTQGTVGAIPSPVGADEEIPF